MALHRQSVICRYTLTVSWEIEGEQGHSGTLWVDLLQEHLAPRAGSRVLITGHTRAARKVVLERGAAGR